MTRDLEKSADVVARARGLAALLAPGAAARDLERRFPHDEIAEMRKTGLFALRAPAERGGGGGSISDFARVVAALAEGDANVAQMYITHTYGVELMNQVQAEPAVKDRFYERLANGLFVTNAYSERGTKTIFDFKTTLERDPAGGWRMNGTKFYCTGSAGGDVLYASGKVVGREGDDDPTRDLGQIRMVFLERDWPGVTIHDDWRGIGQRTTASGTTEFVDVHVPDELCFSTVGLDSPDSLFSIIGQIGFTAVYVGIARAALREGCAFVRERARAWPHSGVERAVDDPYVLHHVGRMQTLVSSAEQMLRWACEAIDEAEFSPSGQARAIASVRVSEAKSVATEVSLEVSERIFQVCGAGAAIEKYDLDRFWRDARTLTLHDPVDYKYRLVGEWVLNGTPPPVTSYT